MAATIFVAGGFFIGVSAGAAPFVAPGATRAAADRLNIVESVQFFWLGHDYCWYDDGWNGPGIGAGTPSITTTAGAADTAGIIGAGDTPIRIIKVAAAVMSAERSLVAVMSAAARAVVVVAVARSAAVARAPKKSDAL